MMGTLWRALRAGESLADPATWKNRQNLINALAAVLGAVLWLLHKLGVGIDLAPDEVAAVAGGVAVVMGAINNYLTTATSTRVGFKDSGDTPPDPSSTAGGGAVCSWCEDEISEVRRRASPGCELCVRCQAMKELFSERMK
jgi:hypothetical protein